MSDDSKSGKGYRADTSLPHGELCYYQCGEVLAGALAVNSCTPPTSEMEFVYQSLCGLVLYINCLNFSKRKSHRLEMFKGLYWYTVHHFLLQDIQTCRSVITYYYICPKSSKPKRTEWTFQVLAFYPASSSLALFFTGFTNGTVSGI